MAVIRVNKTDNYTIMSNSHFKEKEMTLKAKGLLSLMLSLPDDWDYSIAGLVALSKDGKDGVMNALNELEEFGYLTRARATDEKGRFAGYTYDIFENPQTEKPYAEKPNTDKPNAENPPQLNTNKSNTEKINNEVINREGEQKRKRFVPPTLEEVKAYCVERKNNVDAARFIDYYTSNGWLVGKNKMKDWKAAVRSWERNGYSSKPNQGGQFADKSFDTDEFANIAMQSSMNTARGKSCSPRAALEREVISRSENKEAPKTAGNDEAVREKMERLKEKLGV